MVSTSPLENFGIFQRYMNMLTPNWLIPEEKNQPTEVEIFLSLFKLRRKIITAFSSFSLPFRTECHACSFSYSECF